METPAAGLTVVGGNAPPRTKARKDSQGQEEIINITAVKDSVEELERLLERKRAAAKAFSDAVVKTAEKAKINATPLRQFIAARVDDKLHELERNQSQLALLYYDVGE